MTTPQEEFTYWPDGTLKETMRARRASLCCLTQRRQHLPFQVHTTQRRPVAGSPCETSDGAFLACWLARPISADMSGRAADSDPMRTA